MSPGPAGLLPAPLRFAYDTLPGPVPRGEPESPECLAQLLRRVPHPPRTTGGRPVRFVAGLAGTAVDYETSILATGVVPTRPRNWHDYFNALAWCVFPRTKAVINDLHCRSIAEARGARRGAVRDALTQLDECGVLVVSDDPALIDALRAHAWEEAFWRRRDQMRRRVRFLVLGHATLDAARAPYRGLCGKALYREVPAGWLELSPAEMVADGDGWLAHWLEVHRGRLAPALFAPLPLLGVPGVTPDSESQTYYRDLEQFRPRRASGLAGLRCV